MAKRSWLLRPITLTFRPLCSCQKMVCRVYTGIYKELGCEWSAIPENWPRTIRATYIRFRSYKELCKCSRDRRGRHRMVVQFICNICNQCLSPLMLWVRIPFRWGVLDTALCDKVCHLTCGRSVVRGVLIDNKIICNCIIVIGYNWKYCWKWC